MGRMCFLELSEVEGYLRKSIGYENSPAPRHDIVRAVCWGEANVEGMGEASASADAAD
jgi:hypothetical protein